MLDKREWVRSIDNLRQALMLEPRGHADMYGAILTEPERSESDAGVLFMHNEGYSTMCGHGVIAVVTIALERGLLTLRPGQDEICSIRRPAPCTPPVGNAQRDATAGAPVERVAFTNVPSFVLAAGLPIVLGPRQLRVDVAFGGAFYAVVDVESAGLAIDPRRLPRAAPRGDGH